MTRASGKKLTRALTCRLAAPSCRVTGMEHAADLGCIPHVLTALPRPSVEPGALADTIRAVAGGDHDAFARLYAGYVRMVHAVLLARVPHREVDDLVQEVFVAVFMRLGELR